MLVLSRKRGEKVVIGNNITLTVVEVDGNRVRLGFDAPEQVQILREELACWTAHSLDGGSDSSKDAEADVESQQVRRGPTK
jgi:carbon storage regulator